MRLFRNIEKGRQAIDENTMLPEKNAICMPDN